jgi:hypothetical protein
VLKTIDAAGGTPRTIAQVGAQHWAPFFLPDGRHFLYVVVGTESGGPAAVNGIHVGALESGERKLLRAGRGQS